MSRLPAESKFHWTKKCLWIKGYFSIFMLRLRAEECWRRPIVAAYVNVSVSLCNIDLLEHFVQFAEFLTTGSFPHKNSNSIVQSTQNKPLRSSRTIKKVWDCNQVLMTFYRMSTLEKDSVTLYSTIHCNQIRGIKIRLLQNNPSLPSNQRPIFLAPSMVKISLYQNVQTETVLRPERKTPRIKTTVENLASKRDLVQTVWTRNS